MGPGASRDTERYLGTSSLTPAHQAEFLLGLMKLELHVNYNTTMGLMMGGPFTCKSSISSKGGISSKTDLEELCSFYNYQVQIH